MHLGPRVTDWEVGFAGDHAFEAAPGVEVHRLGKLAHDNPFGSDALAPRICCALMEPLRYDHRPPVLGPTVTAEEPLLFTSDDPVTPVEARSRAFQTP